MELQLYTDEQIVRIIEGVEQFGYKIIGMLEPAADEILWLNEGDAIDPLFEPYTMRMTTKGTRSGEGNSTWASCYICRYDFPISTMVSKNGRYYCTKEKCADDLQETLK